MYKDLQEYMRTKISVPLPSKRCRYSTGEMAEAHDWGSCFRIMHIYVEEMYGCLLFKRGHVWLWLILVSWIAEKIKDLLLF